MKGTYYDIFGNERNSSYTASNDGSKIILTSASLVGTGTVSYTHLTLPTSDLV